MGRIFSSPSGGGAERSEAEEETSAEVTTVLGRVTIPQGHLSLRPFGPPPPLGEECQ